MADLTFNVEQLPEMKTAAIVRINGAIDAKTVVLFQEKLDQLQKNGYTRFILDMVGIKYVNSTGLGTLVNVADALESRGGGIALVKIHPKVKVVFDMLGLNAFFKIFSNETEALNFFQKSDPSSASGGSTAQAPAPSAPAPAPSPPPPASPKPKATKPTGAITTKATLPNKPGDPYSLVCAVCGVKLTIPKPGSYKCPRCGTFFKLYEDGTVVFSERKKTSPIQMKLACTEECTEGLNEFVAVLANRIGFSAEEIVAIKECVEEVVTAIIEKAYERKQYLSYNVVINTSSTELKIQISDYGKFLYDGDRSCFGRSRDVMDEFEHKQHPKGGNVINMLKRFQ